jgi:acetoin utilization deacetylase AcuC-like enzyme
MRFGSVLDRAFTKHLTPPGHPERPERLEAVIESFEAWDRKDQVVLYSPRSVDPESILKVHTEQHYAAIKDIAACGGKWDPTG